jgi:hypothetical protein
MHHLVADSWSVGVLRRELAALYDAFRARRPSPLPPLAVQYAEYAAWQRTADFGPGLAFWREHLAGAPTNLSLPFDRAPTPATGYAGDTLTAPLPPDLVDGLELLARAESTSLLAGLLAVFGRLLGPPELVVGTVFSGRVRPELADLIGHFANHAALRLDLSGRPSFRSALRRIRDVLLDAYGHQETPYELVVRELGVEAPAGRPPLVQAACYLADERGDPDPVRQLFAPRSSWDMSCAVVLRDDGPRCHWEYRTELFDQDTIRRIHDDFAALLAVAVCRPDRP